ncbi:MAG TPA: histidine--tRNA ligase [Casimicrobiaceae bacterium]|nr:histidine--tRNA ligase [Casimicrobiaceae bacterium]
MSETSTLPATKPAQVQAVRGMNDVLPDDAPLWHWFEETVRDVFAQYGYREIRTPIVEKTELFVRGVGAVTDIVEKEMYTFDDNGESLSLRPEGTAPTVRAALEHNLLYDGPKRLWYGGPLFRHERPQKGRYRQYHTFGAEALGFPGPDVDIELLLMVRRLWQRLGLGGITLEINTIGSADERRAFRCRLVDHLKAHATSLDEDSRRRLTTNPLRILDSKNPAMQAIIEAAPKLIDTLGSESRAMFDQVLACVSAAGIHYRVNPRLVRGLDYYNATVFEWVTSELGAQSAVCSGGRYDGLFEQLGGKPVPGTGFGIGAERVLLLLKAAGRNTEARPPVYVVHAGSAADAVAANLAESLRDHGLSVVLHAGGGSFKSQMKRADASGARYAVIIGDDEAARGVVGVKPLRETGEQHEVSIADLPSRLV